MPDDERLTWEFIHEVLDVMERHDYHRSDMQHSNRAIGLIHDAARIAGYKRDRAASCTDCGDQSCTTCQWQVQAADAYDQMTGQIIQAVEASAARQRDPDHAAPPSVGPQAAAGKEAGQ